MCWEGRRTLCFRRFAGEKTRSAIDGSSLRGIERHGSLLAASSAGHCNFDALSYSRGLRGSDGRKSIIFCLLAWLASFGFVRKPFVMKEDLFTRGPDKILAAINALDCAVLNIR